MSTAESRATTSIYLLPGMSAEIYMPGFYIAYGNRKVEVQSGQYEDRELLQGYVVQNEDVGSIEPVTGKPAVIYIHNKFGSNKIFFYSRTGEVAIVDIIAVPIHDHSSIVAGGPAFGTYFTDDEVEG